MIAYSEYSSDARIRREAETLAGDHRFEVTVISLKEGAKALAYTLENVNVREVWLKKYRGKRRLRYLLAYFLFCVLSFIHCSMILIRNGIQAVHVHNMPDFLVFSALLPRLLAKKVILDIHDSIPETFCTKFGKRSGSLFRALCAEEAISAAFANKVICVNHIQRDILVARGIPPEKIFVSMNVPDHKRFRPKAENGPKLEKENSFNIAYHGTITRRLGTDLVIEAVAGLAEKIPALHFHLWGSGDCLNDIVRMSKGLGVENRVHYHGTVAVDVLATELEGMNLGIVPNRKSVATELMLPVKMLEYVAMGIPVVAPRLKCIEYYFNDEMVTYFEAEDIESMKDAILNMYLDEPGRWRQAKKALEFLRKYGWETQCQDFLRFYDKV